MWDWDWVDGIVGAVVVAVVAVVVVELVAVVLAGDSVKRLVAAAVAVVRHDLS